jgi:predicted PurR-regulated permease PerM
MLEDIKKELSSIKLLTILVTIAVSIYLLRFVLEFLQNFSDIILILVFGWLLSFILEPLVDLFSKRLKIPRLASTALVFVLVGALIALSMLLFIPDITGQIKVLETIVPNFLKTTPLAQKTVSNFFNSLNNYVNFIPSIAQVLVNVVTILILSFYLVLEKDNINKRLYVIAPKKWHENMHFMQKVIDKTFASFLRLQVIWGLISGLTTWIILSLFGVQFAASTSFLSGLLGAIPVIGPIICLIPTLLVTLIVKPSQVVIIFIILFGIQQLIFNVFGPKIVGQTFKISPVVVMLGLLIGVKIAGFTGAIFAIPVVSISLIVAREFYSFYFKDKEL